MKKYLLFILAVITSYNCSTLEDTYKEMAGDGPIRYVGKCYDVEITPGWEKLTLQWETSSDVTIENIKVKWKGNNEEKFELLPATAKQYTITDLIDGSYEVSVSAVSLYGDESLVEVVYSRPYTMDHEIVRSFPRVVSKYYYVKDYLILFFDYNNQNNELITKSEIEYYNEAGVLSKFEITKEIIEGKFIEMPNKVDVTKPAKLLRNAIIKDDVGNEEEVSLDPLVLDLNILLSSEFKQILRQEYGDVEVTSAFLASITELNINFALNSLEDVLYFPNLKVLNLAKERYGVPLRPGVFQFANDAKVVEAERSAFALKTANKHNTLRVNRYNKHFFELRNINAFTTDNLNLPPPEREFLAADDWEISLSPQNSEDYEIELLKLFDNDYTTLWKPEVSLSFRIHEISIDLKSNMTLKGVQIAQLHRPSSGTDLRVKPNMVKILVSTNGQDWRSPTHLEWETIGNNPREVSDIGFLEGISARYIKFAINDYLVGTNYYTVLSEISIY